MNTYFKAALNRALSVFFCLAILAGCITPCLAAENTLTVKVGFFEFDGYHMRSESGVLSGYGYEILQHLSGYAGIKFEYVGYDKSWSEMQDMLEKGEIDLLSSAQKTPEREARFDFCTTNIGASTTILTVNSDNGKFLESDYQNWSGMRVGMIKGNSRNDSFKEYAAENGFTYKTVYFNSAEDMEAELKLSEDGRKIDAILTSSLRRTTNERVLAEFDSSPFFIMVKKGDTELLRRLNSAIAQLDVCEPGIRTKLTNKYYAPEMTDDLIFTADELAFIEQMKGRVFTAAINPDRAPYSFIEDGNMNGIVYEAALKMIKRSGLNIKFIDVSDVQSYNDAVEAGNIDLRFEIANSYNNAEQNGFWLTVPFLTVPLARLYNEVQTEFITAAEPENRDFADNYSGFLNDIGLKVQSYPTMDETIDAVLSGKADVSYLAIDTASMAVREDITNRLVYDDVFGNDTSYAIAVKNDQSPLLFSIINKAAASISEKEIDSMRSKYAADTEKPFSMMGYIYDYPHRVLIVSVAILGVIILILVLASQIRRKKSEHEHLEKEREQNKLLKDALDAAEKAGAAKSQFLSRVSHEMRTPLNAIIGFNELAKGADPKSTANYLASSEMASRQLLSVINDVLDMSSIESGKLKISNTSFNLKNLITSLTNIYGTQCKQKNIRFETRFINPVDDWMVGDELRVNQILTNLLGNAVKFTQDGHIFLTLSENESADGKMFVRFAVEDTGCGMSSELKERLFKPFEQENASTARKYGGSGLGLSIVKNLVGLMDGSVRVDSEQGKGTVFTVDLPFGKSNVGNNLIIPKNIESLHILAVDDEDSELEYISLVLERMGVRYSCAKSGEEALSKLDRARNENDAYNVCLIDWRMPNLNGVDTTKSIRGKYGDDVVVIVVSAYDFQQAGDAAKKAGANLFLSKPVFQSSLFDLFMTLTDGKIAKPEDKPQSWDFSGKRVLLVEDNKLNQIVATGYLVRCNALVETAENGKIAVDMFEASGPGYYDAVLMDIQMPVMDGFAATKAIRESVHPDGKSIQIIAQTADAFNEDITKALSAGMNAHVSKPINPDIMAKELYKAFTAKTLK